MEVRKDHPYSKRTVVSHEPGMEVWKDHPYSMKAVLSHELDHDYLERSPCYKQQCDPLIIGLDHAYSSKVHKQKRNDHTYYNKSDPPVYELQNLSNLPGNRAITIDGQEFRIVDVPGDSNCFFHCLSLCMNSNLSLSQVFRNSICNSIYDNWNEWIVYVSISHDLPSLGKDDYWDEMIAHRGWASSCELRAAANLLQIKITMWLKGSRLDKDLKRRVPSYTKEVYEADSGNCDHRQIFLLLNQNHYQLLIHLASEPTEANCRKLGIQYKPSLEEELFIDRRKRKKLYDHQVNAAQKRFKVQADNLPDFNNVTDSTAVKDAMCAIRKFELEQMSYDLGQCQVCNELRIRMKVKDGCCKRCSKDKGDVKMFSQENGMDPGEVPLELRDLTLTEQQIICRIMPIISVHLLKHGGIAENGHHITFPQKVNEPVKILPRLPEEIKIVRVQKQGRNDTSKDFKVRRGHVQSALEWLKSNNPAYKDIVVSEERLKQLPENAQLNNLETIEYNSDTVINQLNFADLEDKEMASNITLSKPDVDLSQGKNLKEEVISPDHTNVKSKQKTNTIPWPTTDNKPMSDFATNNFFSLAFPCLFPHGTGDFGINRQRICESMSQWADHLLWYKDGRFAHHQLFKFVVYNIITRKRLLDKSKFTAQQLGDELMSVEELRKMIEKSDNESNKKNPQCATALNAPPHYWAERARELRSLIQFQINEGKGLPSFFATGSCAEFYFKPLRRLLKLYVQTSTGCKVDLDSKTELHETIQRNIHIVAHYFHLRTRSYFQTVMRSVFGVNAFWYSYEFSKLRGMIHWRGLCWHYNREPHSLLYNAVQQELSDSEMAKELSVWAESLGMTACHPGGTDEQDQPRKELWPPPEGTAPPPPPEDKNPMKNLLMDVSETRLSMRVDNYLLTNHFHIHKCSDRCLRPAKMKGKNVSVCRMEFGSSENPGKEVRSVPAIVKDQNGFLQLEMKRDHPTLVQHSQYHTQAWRANGDISIILSHSNPATPSVDDIVAVEQNVSSYICKDNETTALDLFEDVTYSFDEISGAATKVICTKSLVNAMKRDVSAVEATFELMSLPQYNCSHHFRNISMMSSRVLESTGDTKTKHTSLDKYLAREESDCSSWYQFACRKGTVPVLVDTSCLASWPLQKEYCRTMLLIHWPNWRKLTDIAGENLDWISKMETFITSDECPNYVKADVQRANRHSSHGETQPQSDDEREVEDATTSQSEWGDLIHENAVNSDITYELKHLDGDTAYYWNSTVLQCPHENGLELLETLTASKQGRDLDLILADVDPP